MVVVVVVEVIEQETRLGSCLENVGEVTDLAQEFVVLPCNLLAVLIPSLTTVVSWRAHIDQHMKKPRSVAESLQSPTPVSH